ncbi:DUF368 domain-containing protein [Halobacteriovorax sp. GB3]|uniref:DUF368 domain-containing protein n=1 Tax=Halobacteriovorax sp. GB3 TaxID=2719615 RepID=UPI002360AA91|nr:DUF368 domain-containing protein [Halobacteriovorax sp. GB3]MDD0853750.1 DUF368 domain-containing protein [Halobacteriovorax sp. GB3]
MSKKTWKDVWNAGPGPVGTKEMTTLFTKGLAMGTADLIPGVSGGTIAFITGIYEGLLEAIASINKDFFKDLLSLRLKSAFERLHLRFIIPLGLGIAVAILGLARLMHFLLNEHPIPTWGSFFGLIAASILVIWKQLDAPFSAKNMGMIVIGAVFAWMMVSLIPVDTPNDWWFIYLCGVIGITAMILPGLSGSFLLLILGKYEFITGAIKNPFLVSNLATIGVFLCGTVTGLLGFSKILNWFMKHYHNLTMAFLTGILIGSMKKVWPWKVIVESKVIRGKVKVIRDANILPSTIDGETVVAFTLIILGFIAVMWMENYSSKKRLMN